MRLPVAAAGLTPASPSTDSTNKPQRQMPTYALEPLTSDPFDGHIPKR